jgi:hypothetical protein
MSPNSMNVKGLIAGGVAWTHPPKAGGPPHRYPENADIVRFVDDCHI